MLKEDLIRFLETNIDDGAEVDMVIATKDDNYTAFREKPLINEVFSGAYELVFELPDIFEVIKTEE